MTWRWRSVRNWGQLVLAVWLIATGLVVLLEISMAHLGTILAALAVAAGVLILMDR